MFLGLDYGLSQPLAGAAESALSTLCFLQKQFAYRFVEAPIEVSPVPSTRELTVTVLN